MLFACSCVVLCRILPTIQRILVHNFIIIIIIIIIIIQLWNRETNDLAIKTRTGLFTKYVGVSKRLLVIEK